jgi:hypothetical protein
MDIAAAEQPPPGDDAVGLRPVAAQVAAIDNFIEKISLEYDGNEMLLLNCFSSP